MRESEKNIYKTLLPSKSIKEMTNINTTSNDVSQTRNDILQELNNILTAEERDKGLNTRNKKNMKESIIHEEPLDENSLMANHNTNEINELNNKNLKCNILYIINSSP